MTQYLQFQSPKDARKFDTLQLNSDILPPGPNNLLSRSGARQWRVTHHAELDLSSWAAVIVLIRPLSESERSTVYRCYLHCDPESTSPRAPIEIVCKIFRGEDRKKVSRNEYQCYNKLHFLQGNGIPSCFGLFEGELDGAKSSCLILEYCGKPLRGELWRQPWPFKQTFISLLESIHHAGVKHNDFDVYKILVNDAGNPIIIGFEHAQLDHDCPAREVPVVFHERRPLGYPCKEICEAADRAYAWKQSSVFLMGLYTLYNESMTAETLADRVISQGRCQPEHRGWLLPRAEKAIRDYKNELVCRMELRDYNPED